MDFIKQNAFLVGLVLASGLALVVSLLRGNGGKAVSATDATLLINREDALVIDVRDPAEFVTGHLPDARNTPLNKLDEHLAALDQYKERAIIVCCASGIRSAKACEQMRKVGFAKVVNLSGGVGTWTQAGLPLSRGKA